MRVLLCLILSPDFAVFLGISISFYRTKRRPLVFDYTAEHACAPDNGIGHGDNQQRAPHKILLCVNFYHERIGSPRSSMVPPSKLVLSVLVFMLSYEVVTSARLHEAWLRPCFRRKPIGNQRQDAN